MLFNELVSKQSADSRSIMLWINNLKFELSNCKTDNPNESELKKSLLSKLEALECDALAVANHYSDVEAAINDVNVMNELLSELQA